MHARASVCATLNHCITCSWSMHVYILYMYILYIYIYKTIYIYIREVALPSLTTITKWRMQKKKQKIKFISQIKLSLAVS